MQPVFKHQWKVNIPTAKEIQAQIKKQVRRSGKVAKLKNIGAVDVSYSRETDTMYAAIAVFAYPSLDLIEEQTSALPASFPYVPGFLTFREGPALLKAFAKLRTTPELIVYDGQGVAHPRGVGLAAHMGVVFDTPSIGCAKSRLIGNYDEPGEKRGSWSPLTFKGKVIGRVLRTRDRVKPLFVSVGHRISLDRAAKTILFLCQKYRLPKIIRHVHNLSNKARKSAENL